MGVNKTLDVQAVILSGGLGTRLRAVEASLPKTLVNVGGRPFLEHLVSMLSRRGLRRFLFLLGYKSDMVIGFLRDSRWSGLEMKWSVESVPMGTGGALRIAEAMVEKEFVLINGDSYLDFEYDEFLAAFRRSGSDVMMTVYDNYLSTDVPNNVAVSADGYVVRYSKSGGEGTPPTHVDAGVIAARKTILDLLPREEKCSIESIYPTLISGKAMKAYETGRRFFDIGTPQRLAEFERHVTHDHFANTL